MKAGPLRHRIDLEKPDEKRRGSSGQALHDWVVVATRWASIAGISGREILSAQQVVGEAPHRIRFQGRVAGLVPKWRAVDRRTGAIYQIEFVNDKDRLDWWYELLVKATGEVRMKPRRVSRVFIGPTILRPTALRARPTLTALPPRQGPPPERWRPRGGVFTPPLNRFLLAR